MHSNINDNEIESHQFNPVDHFLSRIHEMEQTSEYGATISSEWRTLFNQNLKNCPYPAIHPSGQETFSLYITFPTGVFECALNIDDATSFIKENKVNPIKHSPSNVIASVDQGNINQDPNLIKPNHKNPIMVLQSSFLTENKPYCINGNQRIQEAFLQNDHVIDIYLFKDIMFNRLFYNTISMAIYYLEIDYNNVMTDKRWYSQNNRDAFVYNLTL